MHLLMRLLMRPGQSRNPAIGKRDDNRHDDEGVGNAIPGRAALSTIYNLAVDRSMQRRLAVSLAAAALVLGLITYAELTGIAPFGDNPNLLLLALYLDIGLLLLLVFLIARGVIAVWIERRQGSAGSQLHIKLVAIFSLLAILPALLLSTISVLFFNFGVEAWFSDRVRIALNESRSAAEIYLNEHKNNIRLDATAMASDLNRDAAILQSNQRKLHEALNIQATVRELTEAIIFEDKTGNILARAGLSYFLESERISPDAMTAARAGEIATLTSKNDDRIRALLRLSDFPNAFLYVGRLVDPIVLGHMQRTENAVAEFEQLELKRADLQLSFVLIFAIIGILLLLAAIWAGLIFARQISRPIRDLISTLDNIRHTGNLETRAIETTADEISPLIQASNDMFSALEASQKELIDANDQLDQRRRFTETILSGVSAGVIGLDSARRINLPNRRASELLGINLDESIGRPLDEVVPEIQPILEKARSSYGSATTIGEIIFSRDMEMRTLQVRVATERGGASTGGQGGTVVSGYVVTYDDVTDLLSAQRLAAWSDIARRIAHEIKNPLTPILLSAERLQRKYESEIKDDRETFLTCTNTIIHQVEDIGRMVDEFSHFARQPGPVMRAEEDVGALCREAAFLHRNSHPEIEFTVEMDEEPVTIRCDRRQVRQALINLLKNAIEAIEERPDSGGVQGRITVFLTSNANSIMITIEDNGKGFPLGQRNALTQPYYTTRAAGTGLGLAMVKKIMDDHSGRLVISDAPGGGAVAKMIFPIDGPRSAMDNAVTEVSSAEDAGETPLGENVKVVHES